MEGAFLDGGPGWEVEGPFTDEIDIFGVSVELPVDLLLVLPGEVPGMLTAGKSQWGCTAHGGAAPSQEPPLHPAYQQMGKQTKIVKPSLFFGK